MSYLSFVLTPKSCCSGVLVSFRLLVVASPIAVDENLLVPVDVALLHRYPQPQKYGWFQCIPAVLNREFHYIIYLLRNCNTYCEPDLDRILCLPDNLVVGNLVEPKTGLLADLDWISGFPPQQPTYQLFFFA